jgi:protein-disulfide isomerase
MNKVVLGAVLGVVALAAYATSQQGAVAPKAAMEKVAEKTTEMATDVKAETTAVISEGVEKATDAVSESDSAVANATTPLAVNALLQQQPYDRVLGNAKAPVTIVEYSSLSCPHCADFHEKTMPVIEKNYVETGKVRFMARPFALNESALRGSQLTMCVPAEKYYTFMNVLFSMQQKWAMTLDYKDNLKRIAKVGGISDAEFDACMADKKVEEQIVQIRKDASETLTIEATPTFFVNGEKVQGDVSAAELSEIIDKKLKAASN